MRSFFKVFFLSLVSLLLLFQSVSALIPITPSGDTAGKKLAGWSFDQSNPAYIKDITGNGFNVKAVESPSFSDGIIDSSLKLFDKSHLLTVENSEKAFAVPKFTIETWVNYDKDPSVVDNSMGQLKIFDFNSIQEGIREGYSLYIQSGGILSMSMPDINGYYWNVCSSKSTLLPGHWYHVAGTYDGQKMRVYINGTLAGVVEHTSGYPLPHGNAHIGCQIRRDGSINSCFFGKFDEMSLYDYVLSQEDLQKIYKNSAPVTQNPTEWFEKERGLLRECFNANDMSKPVSRGIVPQINEELNFQPSEMLPVGEIQSNNFIIRWTGYVQPAISGKYNFYAISNCPVKLWINDRLINLSDAGSESVILSAGQKYPLKMEFYEKPTSGYNVSLKWSSYDVPKEIIPENRLLPPQLDGTGTGLKGEYFNNTNMTGPALTRVDPQVCFDWVTGSPDPSISSSDFSARWTGKVQPRYTGLYTFYTTTDDGVRLWVNEKLIIDAWKDAPIQQNSGTIELNAWEKYNIKMEYFQGVVRSAAILEWSSADQKREVIPMSQLYPGNPVATPTVIPTLTLTPTPSLTPTPTSAQTLTPTPALTPTPTSTNTNYGDSYITMDFDKTLVLVGETVTAQIRINNIKNFIGAEVNLKYDPLILQPVTTSGMPYSSGTTFEKGSLLNNNDFVIYQRATNDVTNGILHMGKAYIDSEKYRLAGNLESSGVFGVVRFKALKSAAATNILFQDTKVMPGAISGTMLFDWNSPDPLKSYSVRQPDKIRVFDCIIPTPVPLPSVKPGHKIRGYLNHSFDGFVFTGSSQRAGFKVEIIELDKSVLSDESGCFEIMDIPDKSEGYTLRISKNNFIVREIKNIVLTGNVQIGTQSSPLIMMAGDVKINGLQDNVINMADIMEVAKYFNSILGDGKYQADYDINKDVAINMNDIFIIAKQFNKSINDYPPVTVIPYTE